MQRDFNKKEENPKLGHKLLGHPFFIIGIVASTVFILLGGMQMASMMGQKVALIEQQKSDLTEDSSQSTLPSTEEDNALLPGSKSEKQSKVVKSIKKEIAEAKDKKTLEKIEQKLKTKLSEFEKEGQNKELYSKLIRSIKSKELSLPSKNTGIKSEVDLNETALIETQAKAFLTKIDFDLIKTTAFLKEYNGVNFNTLEALETYKSIAQHKKDYLFLISKLRKLKDDSYFEKGEKLLQKRFKSISLDQFDEENYNWTTKNKPSWMSQTQVDEIKNWWNILDDEIERIDSDY